MSSDSSSPRVRSTLRTLFTGKHNARIADDREHALLEADDHPLRLGTTVRSTERLSRRAGAVRLTTAGTAGRADRAVELTRPLGVASWLDLDRVHDRFELRDALQGSH